MVGRRVEIPEYTSQWRAGDRFGVVVEMVTRRQYIRGRLVNDRKEDDKTVWVPERARVKLDGSGETIEVVLADCNEFDAAGKKVPPAKRWQP